MVLLEDNFPASELVLQCPPKVCDQGKGGKQARLVVGLPERGSKLFRETGLAASRSKDSKSFGGGSAKRSRMSLGCSNEMSRILGGVSGLLLES